MSLVETDQRKVRIKQIACEMVASQVEKGEVNPDDDAALRAAVAEAVDTARAVYDAALEYVS